MTNNQNNKECTCSNLNKGANCDKWHVLEVKINNKEWEEDYTIFGGGMLVRNDRLKSGGIVANKETRRSIEEILQKEREKNLKEMTDAILVSKEGWIEEGAQKERQRICEELEGMKKEVDERYDWENEPEATQEYIRGKGWGFLGALTKAIQKIND